jgi:hypothetical protein
MTSKEQKEEMYLYYSLLVAIFNSDSIDDNKYSYEIIVYDTYTSLPFAVFKNASSCAKFFNTSRSAILSWMSTKRLRKKRYLIERV